MHNTVDIIKWMNLSSSMVNKLYTRVLDLALHYF